MVAGQLHDTWIFHITEEGSNLKSTKTAGSTRVVSVHGELTELGLISCGDCCAG
jgi:hypothetical protein